MSKNRTPALAGAQSRYSKKLGKSGRRRLPGGFIPEDVVVIIDAMVERGEAKSASGAIWTALREREKNRR